MQSRPAGGEILQLVSLSMVVGAPSRRAGKACVAQRWKSWMKLQRRWWAGGRQGRLMWGELLV